MEKSGKMLKGRREDCEGCNDCYERDFLLSSALRSDFIMMFPRQKVWKSGRSELQSQIGCRFSRQCRRRLHASILHTLIYDFCSNWLVISSRIFRAS